MSEPTYRVEKSQDGKWRVGFAHYDPQGGGLGQGGMYWDWYPYGTEEAAMRAYGDLVEVAKEAKRRAKAERDRIWILVEEE